MAKPFAVIDAETDPFDGSTIPAPFIWGFFDGENYETFEQTAALVDHISGFDGVVYAHNGGKFDFHFLLEYIEPYSEVMIINGRISKMRLGDAELRDSYNIIPAPLSAYKKTDIDYNKMRRDVRHKHMKEIRAYLRDDCVDLYELIKRFINDYGNHLTQAGASMAAWSKISKTPVPKTDKEFYDSLKCYYYGGRVQCFEKGIIESDFSVFDINSAYPYAMLQKHPYSENYATYNHWHKNTDFVSLWAISFGALPYRGQSGLDFPNDGIRRFYTVSRWEYDAAIETASLAEVEIVATVVFCGHTDFSEYILPIYEQRNAAKADNDLAGSLLLKLAMNSLYGKFASNPEDYKVYQTFPFEHAGNLARYGWQFAGEFGPWALGEAPLDSARQRYYNVATGASITGYVRAMLWRAIHASEGVMYCDTDSIAVRKQSSLSLGGDLGQWKHEGDFVRAGIGGKKLYIFEDAEGNVKTASKGVQLSNSQLWDVARGECVEYAPQAPTFSIHGAPKFVNRLVQRT